MVGKRINAGKTINNKETGKGRIRGTGVQTLQRLLSYMRAYKGTLILVAVCILLSTAASVASSMFLGNLIDDYITPLLADPVPDFVPLIKILIVMAAVYLLGTLASWIYNRAMVIAAQGTLKSIRDEMFEKMQRLPVGYFDRHTHGEIMSVYTNDTDTLRQMIAQSLSQMISSVVTIAAVFLCMLYYSIPITLIVVAVLAATIRLAGFVAGRSGRCFAEQQAALASLDGYVEEMTGGMKVVKVFCREDRCREEFREKNNAWVIAAGTANGYANAMMPMMNGLGYIQYVIIALVGAAFALAGVRNPGLTGFHTVTLGMIASFLTLSRSITNPISQISNQFNSIITALAGAERIFALMDEAPETDEGYVTLVNASCAPAGRKEQMENGDIARVEYLPEHPAKEDVIDVAPADGLTDTVIIETKQHTGMWAWKHPHQADNSLTYQKLNGRVTLDHVDFSYVPGKQVLYDVTLTAEPGMKIAFVGATGAGKTTITNLINRFYDIDDGKIRYDDININKIRKADLRRAISVVLQEVNLFTGTVMENIRYGNREATDEECIAAARLANADSFIRMLPEGYNTVLKGNGSGLSQGQRQLLSIARAAVADPPVMILDEATSSIDTRTEALVQDGMDKLMEGRTVFVIAHRLSTVRNSDLICVLDHGRIIERGSHEELIAAGGRYYQLYTGAFELE